MLRWFANLSAEAELGILFGAVFIAINIAMYLTSDRSENFFKYLYHQYF